MPLHIQLNQQCFGGWNMWLACTYYYVDIYRIAGDQSFIVYDCRTCDFIFETYSKCQATYITLIVCFFIQKQTCCLKINHPVLPPMGLCIYGIWTTRTQDNSCPGQLVPRTTRTKVNSYPGQLVPKTTRAQDNSSQDNSYPGQLVTKSTRTLVTLCPGQLVPMTICTQDNSYSRQLIPKTIPTQGMSYPRQLIDGNSHRPNHNHTSTHGYLFRD